MVRVYKCNNCNEHFVISENYLMVSQEINQAGGPYKFVLHTHCSNCSTIVCIPYDLLKPTYDSITYVKTIDLLQ